MDDEQYNPPLLVWHAGWLSLIKLRGDNLQIILKPGFCKGVVVPLLGIDQRYHDMPKYKNWTKHTTLQDLLLTTLRQ